jgi:hypothetical protein
MRIIFLDIDGVMNSETSARSNKGCLRTFAAKSIDALNEIIFHSKADIVIASSWRICHPHPDTANQLKEQGVCATFLGDTPFKRSSDKPSSIIVEGLERGHEIQAWLDSQEFKPESICIIDDSDDMVHLMPYLVQTTWENGLGPEHISLAIEKLSTPYIP